MPKRVPDLREVGVTELKVHAAAVIKRVEDGQRIVVIRRRNPAALLIPWSQAHHFAIAFAEELVEMRKLSREELAAGEAIEPRDVLEEKPGGQGRADRFGIVIAPSAAHRLSEPRFPARRAARLLGQLAIRAARNELGPPARWLALRETRGSFVILPVGHRILLCDVDSAARRIAVLGCVHRSELTRWIWSDGLPPMRVLVAAHLDGFARRLLPDAD